MITFLCIYIHNASCISMSYYTLHKGELQGHTQRILTCSCFLWSILVGARIASIVTMATLGSNPSESRHFLFSTPLHSSFGDQQPPEQWVLGLVPRIEAAAARPPTHPHLAPRLRMSRAVPLIFVPLSRYGVTLPLPSMHCTVTCNNLYNCIILKLTINLSIMTAINFTYIYGFNLTTPFLVLIVDLCHSPWIFSGNYVNHLIWHEGTPHFAQCASVGSVCSPKLH
jgi:hypothetical protein